MSHGSLTVQWLDRVVGCAISVAFVAVRIALNEIDTQPAKYVIHQASGQSDLRILGVTAGFKALVGEFPDKVLQRDSILQRDAGQCGDGVHQSTDGGTFL